ncbi:putative helicase [Oscillibacter valericigenes Sjm18-20]|nr:putative helicase [Oscillibacter valericigenes Sjm18-20]
MPTKVQAYSQMADHVATQITGSYQGWTEFLQTAARLYKYPYNEQLMIYAQRPDATACAEYDFWNNRMGRYVRRGSKGIALIDASGDRPRLKYVFDVSDTGGHENARQPYLWSMESSHVIPVAAMLERNYEIGGDDLAQQIADIAGKLADDYWNDHQYEILHIVDDSFLEEYDEFNIGMQFRSAAAVSITYAVMSRCGLEPEQVLDHEDFMAVFDFNTPATVAALGTAVSEASQQLLRQIGVTILNAEREKIAERSQNNEQHTIIHEERGLSDSRPEAVGAAGNEPRQIREDAEGLPEGTPPDSLEQPDPIREAVPAPAGDRADGPEPLGADDAGAGESGGRDRSPESQRPDEVGGPDEQLQGAGGGSDPERADFQLNFFDVHAGGVQMTLFPSEDEQIAYLEQAESVDKTPFAFSFAQEDIDTILRLGGNNSQSRMRIAAEYMKRKPMEEIAAFLSREYVGGGGFKLERGDTAAWFDQDGIHLTNGRTARYSKSAQVASWNDAARRIGELLEQGRFATNVELAETNGYIRSQLAQPIWFLRHDFDEPAVERGFLPCLEPMDSGGYPEITEKLADALKNPEFLSTLTAEFTQFLDAYREDRALLRFHYHRPGELLDRLHDLALPQREYTSEMSEPLQVDRFITEDEINAMLAGGSSVEGGKGRIYGYFKEPHSLKEQVAFLKSEYGIGGHSNALPGCFESDEDHSGKGIRIQKSDCYDVQLAWNNVAKRISELIRQDRYLTPEEKAKYEELHQEPIPETMQEPPVPLRPISQDDIDDALRAWNGDAASKRAVAQYMAAHARDKDTAAWLAHEYGAADANFLSITRTGTDEVVELPWAKVQRRIAQLVQTDSFYTDRELDDFADIDTDAVRQSLNSPAAQERTDAMLEAAERIAAENAVEPYERFAVVESENGWVIWDDLHDGYYVDDEGVTEEFDSEWLANDYLFEVREAVAEKEAAEWLEVEQAKTEPEEPAAEQSMPVFPYSVGDTVYLENGKPFVITEIRDSSVQFRDPTLRYPIFRAESSESFARLMERFPQPEKPAPAAQTSAKPEMTAETVAVYPADENHLPYDIVVERLHTEPEHTPPEIVPQPENFRITDDNLGIGGAKAKFRANMDAISTLLQVESENRAATPDEQEVLAKYVGWGGLADAFDESKQNWANEYQELAATLSPEEYAAARASTLNAHYTSPTVIKAIYEAVGNMGFQSGNILEPAMGVGNFFGCLPEEMRGSKLYGVELDSITGRIARQLYPQADITVAGFETTDRRDFFDLAIGNVPFGQYQVNDRAYNKLGFSIHDYFFAKSLDQVRPGGVVAFVTSRYMMDKQFPEVRKYIAQRAELLGAIRLPNNAFRANAGTDVVSDIIFLQKRDRPIDIEPDWVHLGQNEDGFGINSYFIDHPEMILGRQTSESTQYGKQDFTVAPIEGLNLADQLHDAVKYIGGKYTEAELPELGEDEAIDTSIPADPNVKNYSYTVVDGSVYYRENSRMVKPNLNATAMERVKGMVDLRDCVHKLIDLQMDESDPLSIIGEQHKLNRLYDDFSAKYGLLNDRANRLAFSDDSSYYLLCSLEVLDDDGNLERKADMFTKRTIKQHTAVTSVDTASEALAVSIGERARVDLPFMARLSGKSEEEIIDELTGVIYHDPIRDNWQTSDEYLSGNVRQKLREAQAAAKRDPAYQINVAALEKAQPKDLDASEIEVRLGATWIDKKYIQQFMEETFNPPFYLRRSIQVNYSSYTAEWNITGKNNVGYGNVAATVTYGTDRANAYRILEDSLNLRDIRIYDTVEDPDGKERRVLNAKETTLTAQKQQAIRDAFKDWIWRDPHRRSVLVAQYNEEMNSTRPREYDGSHITFTGMNPEIQLRDHQKNAVAHVLYGGNTLLAHEVGAGKTFEMVAACMESKRLGLSQKSIFVVPNHLTEQWASEFLRLYPSANLLVTTKKDFETHNRKKFCARIATGDYDAVIIGHSQFERIPISSERQERLLQEQIDEITDGIDEVQSSGGERFTVKQLERTRKGLEARLEKLQASDRKDDVVTFEQLGCDRMFVDESDNYKNLFLYTKMRNVAGLSTTDAQKSSDMFAKCRYLDELTGNRGTVFATGTPISNSMTEMYTIQRYLQYDRLRDMNMTHFDCWASRFGETTTALELAPEGTGYRARTRFAMFFNLPELMNMFREVADIKTAEQLNLPTPEVEYHTIATKPTEHQQAMVKALSERAAKVHSGAVDPSVDNMLKITSDGRKLGLDQRIINSMLPDEPGTKVNQCVDNIVQFWRDGEADKLTQLVFCDISTPRAVPTARAAKAVSGNLDSPEIHGLETSIDLPEPEADFTVYEDIRQKLIEKGIPAEQVAFIHDANTDVRKKELFGKVRSGQVRVLIGSTAKMGAGTNVQDRLIAMHDLDCPWRPRDLTQRKGRIERQGNQNEKVHVCRYVTEGTFDAYLWQTVENKQRFISQIMSSKSPVRSCDDVDETALSFAEIKALCAGDPRIKERMDLDVDVSRLKIMKADHQSKQFRLEDNLLKYFPEQIEQNKGFITSLETDMQTLAQHPHPTDSFAGMEVRGDVLTDKENAGAALLDACKEVTGLEPVQIGSYRGFSISVTFDAFEKVFSLTLKGKMTHRVDLGKDPRGNLVRIDNTLDKMPERLAAVKAKLENLYQQQAAAQAEVGKPFPQEAELREKTARLVELDSMLNMDGKDQTAPENVVAKSPRPSVLEKLKVPCVSETQSRKPQKEMEER